MFGLVPPEKSDHKQCEEMQSRLKHDQTAFYEWIDHTMKHMISAPLTTSSTWFRQMNDYLLGYNPKSVQAVQDAWKDPELQPGLQFLIYENHIRLPADRRTVLGVQQISADVDSQFYVTLGGVLSQVTERTEVVDIKDWMQLAHEYSASAKKVYSEHVASYLASRPNPTIVHSRLRHPKSDHKWNEYVMNLLLIQQPQFKRVVELTDAPSTETKKRATEATEYRRLLDLILNRSFEWNAAIQPLMAVVIGMLVIGASQCHPFHQPTWCKWIYAWCRHVPREFIEFIRWVWCDLPMPPSPTPPSMEAVPIVSVEPLLKKLFTMNDPAAESIALHTLPTTRMDSEDPIHLFLKLMLYQHTHLKSEDVTFYVNVLRKRYCDVRFAAFVSSF